MKELPKHFDFADQSKIYKFWEEGGYFKPKEDSSKKPFTIIMPPPNANGSLHAGHAVFVTLEDIMIRYHRMQGHPTLWLPGADHAGFETQVVFEKKLEKEGRSRFNMPRGQLYRETLDFTLKNKDFMENQLRELGASCDWSREKFTLDPDIIDVVYDTFKKLHDDGLAYRGIRPVNWCTKHQTSLSDLEVKYEEQVDPLYYIKYGPLTLATVRPETKFGDTALAVHPNDKRYSKYIGKEIEIDTLLGKANISVIADEYVNPKFGTGVVKITPAHDPNDFEVAGRHNLEIREIIDQYGKLNEKTGPYVGMKVKEARTRIVEDMEKRGMIDKIDPGYTHTVGKCYKCGSVIEPRVIPQWFIAVNKKGLKTKKTLAPAATKAVKDGDINFATAKYRKIYLHWMNNIRDWNISRQIVWGIQIPAWYIKIPKYGDRETLLKGFAEAKAYSSKSPVLPRTGDEYRYVMSEEDVTWLKKEMIGKSKYDCVEFFDGKNRTRIDKRNKTYTITDKVSRVSGVVVKHGLAGKVGGITVCLEQKLTAGYSQYEAEFTGNKPARFKNRPVIKSTDIVEKYNLDSEGLSIFIGRKAPEGGEWTQDPDVFDTWFSSGQWPFATLMTNEKDDFDKYYPTSVMETGWDILFFWVARMIMLGLYVTDRVPFHTVILHGLVRDKDKKKMSKSKGNVIDPLGIVETYGADALRMALVFGTGVGNDAVITEDKFRGFRNFGTKIWNASKFTLGNLDDFNHNVSRETIQEQLTTDDLWILKELQTTVDSATKAIETYRFHQAAETIYEFFWHKFCDKTIENTKNRIYGNDEKSKLAAQWVLYTVLTTSLKLLHPFMPFITESIWSTLDQNEPLIISEWPTK